MSGTYSSNYYETDYSMADYHCDPIPAQLLQYLEDDVEGKISHIVVVEDFVHHVWGVQPTDAQEILATHSQLSLKGDLLEEYQVAIQNENDMAAPFAALAEDLVDRARALMGCKEESPITFSNGDSLSRIWTQFTNQQPDILVVPRTVKEPGWLVTRQIIAFKREVVNEDEDEISPPEDPYIPPAYSPSNEVSKAVNNKPEQCSGDSPSVALPTAGQKRKFEESKDGGQSKRVRKQPQITIEELQLATFALESMVNTTRHYTSGIFIDRFNISLWYYDRACIIHTEYFNFQDAPAKLALILYALSICDDKHAGFDPFMIPNPTLDLSQIDALKNSWPAARGTREARMLDTVTKNILEWRDHLPEVTSSGTWEAGDPELSPVELLKTLSTAEFEGRELHVISMKLSMKLWEVDSVEEFKQVFVDCVECHYNTFVIGQVLHGDLSDDSLMFTRKDGIVQGIVNGWDMASILTDSKTQTPPITKHRAGAIPFMACELLTDSLSPHLYRHDLESFFFILVWASVHYDLPNKKRMGKVHQALKHWNDPDMNTAGLIKSTFMTHPRSAMIIFGAIREEFEAMKEEWLKPLWTLFRDGLMSLPYDDGVEIKADYDLATYGGRLTFHTFMEALGRKPRFASNSRVES